MASHPDSPAGPSRARSPPSSAAAVAATPASPPAPAPNKAAPLEKAAGAAKANAINGDVAGTTNGASSHRHALSTTEPWPNDDDDDDEGKGEAAGKPGEVRLERRGSRRAAADARDRGSHAARGAPENGARQGGDDEDSGGGDDDGDVQDDAGEAEEADDALQSLSHAQLVDEVRRAREQRDGFEAQYQGLLSKLTQMRNTLGERLRQDAEELDRRGEQIDSLNSQVDELQETVDTLKSELVSSHTDAERLTRELDSLRISSQEAAAAAAANAASSSSSAGGMSMRELQETAERLRLDAEGWESACLEERAAKQELEAQLQLAGAQQREAERREEEWRSRSEMEADAARGLQAVLEEFQATQDAEVKRSLRDYEERYEQMASSLEEHKARALKAEAELTQSKDDVEKCKGLEREVKEKNLLIGKLRHEAVILNEHLTEALRRLRSDAPEANVDRRLVSNLILQFVAAPRGDAKKFEMLSLIASVLSWSEEERETAGLRRGSAAAGMAASRGHKVGISATREAGGKGHLRSPGVDGNLGDESFSNLFVEFLLRESTGGSGQGGHGAGAGGNAQTLPSTPTSPGLPSRPSFNLGSLASLRRSADHGHRAGPSPSQPGTPSAASTRSPASGLAPLSPSTESSSLKQ